jgi:predicted phosphoadenosine phosphosulfate sulfurtransferase
MQLSVDNLGKPSNKLWKKIADYLLYTLPVILTGIMAIPISEDLKLWLNFGLSVVIVLIKGASKFTAEENQI